MASHADARFNRGRWLLRIEDLDPPRESKVAATTFPVVLDRYGFEWDGPILYQSTRGDAYAAALETLVDRGLAFECSCTRSDLADAPIGVGGDRIYPGTCRDGTPADRRARQPRRSWRLRVDDIAIAFVDRIQGRQRQQLASEVGDFVIRRADGYWAYQLAVVVDDRAQGITDIVRGADLLASTPRQILLQRHLGAIEPRYAHVPVAVNQSGEKLSKQTLAAPLPATDPVPMLLAAWRFLGQAEPEAMPANAREFWSWAFARWNIGAVDPRPRSAPNPAIDPVTDSATNPPT